MTDEEILADADSRRDNDPNGARDQYTRLLDTPLASRARLGLGILYSKRGLFDKAAAQLHVAAEDPMILPRVQVELGGVELRQGNVSAARDFARKALKLAPGYNLAEKLLAKATPPDEIKPAQEPPASATVADIMSKKDLTVADLEGAPGDLKWGHRPVWWCPPGVGGGGLRTAALLGLLAIPVVWFALQSSQGPHWVALANRLLWAAWPPLLLFTGVWAVLRWWTTWYVVYERRIEVHAGVLFRTRRGIWLYDVERPVYSRSNPWQTLTHTATVIIESEKLPARSLGFFFNYQKAGGWGQLKLVGFGNRARTDKLVTYLTRQILHERRAVKATFV
ncbi:PH domain-containing protein [Actinocrispum wychmicini]|uniref:PH (Pleckstrin Homology) domain-containing protein n=1 Tax=Actinocrispum wychmicini TaxID=1213861 RepID=A0A4R2JHX3_9PSEU|nr:PH domain-containing protein [Actinocrispum wychmicini]TCO58327.1 PH (Pleckstrin Homology) domain-containing protein [Actinocrispum wychmicini]